MSSNGSTHKPGDGALQQQNFKSSSLPGSPRMPASPANSVPSASSTGGGGIKVKIKRTSSTDSRHASNNSNGNKATNFLETSTSVSPGSNSSLMEFSIDTEMSSCLSNSSSTNSKSDNGASQPLKYEGGISSSSGKASNNVLKRHLDGYPPSSTNQQQNYQSLQNNLNQNQSRREPPLKKTKINGGGGEDLQNGDCQKNVTNSSTQQNKSLSSSSSLTKMVISSDSSSTRTNSSTTDRLQNGINSNSETKSLNDSSPFTPSVLNYALTSTSSPSSQSSSIPESDLVLDSSSGLMIKKSDEIRDSDSPIPDLKGPNGNEVGTMTDPDSLGPCEPGTAVKLQGIVWQETDKGLLVLNVTWKNKTFMGTLLDCHRQSDSHKWAGPKDPQSSGSKKGGKRGRGSRSRTPPVKLPMSKKSKNKLIPGIAKSNNGSIPESPLTKDNINNRRRLPPVNYGESDDEDIMPKDDESGDETNTNTKNESLSPSSRLIECPKPQCFKKFRDLDALKYHLSYTHNDLKDDKPPIKTLKKKKKLLAKRRREPNSKDIPNDEKKDIKKEHDTSLLESTLNLHDTKIKHEIKTEGSDCSKHSSSKMFQAINGSDFSSIDTVKSEPFTKNSANCPPYNPHYPVYGSSTNPQPLALTACSSSALPPSSHHYNSQDISAGSSNLKSSTPQHNINYLMSNQHQQPLNFESSKPQGLYQPPPAHGSSHHPHPPPPPLMQNGARGPLSMAKELDGRLASFAQNGSNDLRPSMYQPSPINLGPSKDSLTNKAQNQHSVQLQRQRSSGGPASPAYSDISDEELSSSSTGLYTGSGNGTNSNQKMPTSRGFPSGSNQTSSQSRSTAPDHPRKSNNESLRPTSSQLPSSAERKMEGTKPSTQTFGPPPQHLPPELHGGSLAFPPHLASGIPGLPPGFPPHLVASLAASMGAAANASGHRFPSPMPPMPGMPGPSNQNVKALDILQQHANQYIATSKLQELQDRAGMSKNSGASNSSAPPSPSPAMPKSPSPSMHNMNNLLGINRGNVATSSPPLLRHEHNHTHLHLGYPPGFPPQSGLSGTSSGGPSSVPLPTASNATQGSSLRGVAPPIGSIAVPGAPSPSHLPPPSPSSLMSGLFASGAAGTGHGMRLSSSAFPPK